MREGKEHGDTCCPHSLPALTQFMQPSLVTGDQGFFLGPTPALELAFALDGGEFGGERFLVENRRRCVPGGVMGTLALLV